MQDSYTTGWHPGAAFWIVWCVFLIFEIASWWVVFEKAGKPGWAAIIPIYNAIVILEISGRPLWWILLYLIPLVNIVIGVIVLIDFAKSFGKGVGFAVGIILLAFIFIPLLAFGDAQYQGPAAGGGGSRPQPGM